MILTFFPGTFNLVIRRPVSIPRREERRDFVLRETVQLSRPWANFMS